MANIRTLTTSITMPYPGNAFLCCPPCQVPRANLKLTNYIGPIQPNDPNQRTVCYYDFASVPYGFPTDCNATTVTLGNGQVVTTPSVCSTEPCITIVYKYVQYLVTDEQTLVYNSVYNMWGPTNWYYSQGTTQTGSGQASNPQNGQGQTLPPVNVSVDKATYTFTRWSAICAGAIVPYGNTPNYRFAEGANLTLYKSVIQLTGTSTDDPTSLLNTFLNNPLNYQLGNASGIIFAPGTSLQYPFIKIITQCNPFMYQQVVPTPQYSVNPLAGQINQFTWIQTSTINTGVTLTQA